VGPWSLETGNSPDSRTADAHPTVDCDRRPGEEAALVAGEEQGEVRDLLRTGMPTGRDRLLESPRCRHGPRVRCVSRVYTDLAVFLVEESGVTVRETFGISFEALADLVPVPLRRSRRSAG
jgi:hypothetical protein